MIEAKVLYKTENSIKVRARKGNVFTIKKLEHVPFEIGETIFINIDNNQKITWIRNSKDLNYPNIPYIE